MKEALTNHLKDLCSFDCLGYEEDKTNTLECVASTLFDEVIRHDRRRLTQSAKFKEAAQGLPSYIALPFYNDEIENLMYALGSDNKDNVSLYWNMVGDILSNAFNKVAI